MPEITYKEVDRYFKNIGTKFPPVFLIYGEEYLMKSVSKILLDKLLPEFEKSLNYEALDGDNENVPTAIEKVNTFSLLSDRKVVALLDSRIFYTKQDSELVYEKAKATFKENQHLKAATYFMTYLALANLDLHDLSEENRSNALNRKLDEEENDWLDKIIRFCLSEGLRIPSSGNPSERLANAVEKGFPPENHLIITTELVDKRRLLYKSIKEKGLIVDCSVPKGARKADLDQQSAVLSDTLKTLLKNSGKSLDADAYKALIEKTGFDLRMFTGSIEKLVNYVGDRTRITASDVASLLKRTKIDPIFELTNAMSDRNKERSLFFLKSLLSGGLHPLQIVAAITNQLRKLLLYRSLIDELTASGWHQNMSFNEFKSKIVPLMVENDKALNEQLIQWEGDLNPEDGGLEEGKKKKKKTGKKTISSDLFVAQNPNNAYPIYQLLKKSSLFTVAELLAAMEHIGHADRLLKTSALDPKTIIEKALVNIC